MLTQDSAAQLTQSLCDVLISVNRLRTSLHGIGFRETDQQFFYAGSEADPPVALARAMRVADELRVVDRVVSRVAEEFRDALLTYLLDHRRATVEPAEWQPFPATVPDDVTRVELRGRWRNAITGDSQPVLRIAERRTILAQPELRWCVGLEPIEVIAADFTEWRKLPPSHPGPEQPAG